MKILIQGARLLDPKNGVDVVQDVLIENDRISAIGTDLPQAEATVVPAQGKVLTPGLVDIHVHLREPGREHKETIATGCRAAAAGGFTSVCCMPNTLPPIDSTETIEYVLNKALQAAVECYPIAAITMDQKGQHLTNVSELKAAGAIAFSDDGEPVSDSLLLYQALIASKTHGLPIIVHCEDKQLAGKGAMHEGYRSTLLNIPGIPAAAEDAMVARDLTLAEASGGKLHIAHVSTKGAITLIRQAKERGVQVTCEVTPHHLCLTHDVVEPNNTNTKMNPPLRTQEDVQALRLALRDGVIDCIATDHAPHHRDEKAAGYKEAPFGIVGLETALPLMYTELVASGLISLAKLVQLMSINPAMILNINVGELVVGGLANLTLIDTQTERQVDSTRFYSLGTNTPFDGRTLRGWPAKTIVSGKIVMKDGVVHA